MIDSQPLRPSIGLAILVTLTAGAVPVVASSDFLVLTPSRVIHVRASVRIDGRAADEARAEYLRRFMVSLDADGDGRITTDESKRSPIFNTSRDTRGNAYLARLAARRRGGGRTLSRRQVETAIEAATGAALAFRQTRDLSRADTRVFDWIDADGSGQIDTSEIEGAGERIRRRDLDGDGCVTFDEFLTESPGVAMAPVMVEVDPAVDSVRATDVCVPRTVGGSSQLIDRYDVDGDGSLDGDEIGWTDRRVAGWDVDGSGGIDRGEWIAGWNRRRGEKGRAVSAGEVDILGEVDIVAEVDLDEGAAAVRVVAGPGWSVTHEAGRAVAVDESSTVRLTLAARHFDPVSVAVDRAGAMFTTLDADASGQLQRDEITGRFRFESYLFDAMDRNDDARVDRAEMAAFARGYAMPARYTTRVTLHDMGVGYFGMIDRSGDGRISRRELGEVSEHLSPLVSMSPSVSMSPFGEGSRGAVRYRLEWTFGQASPLGGVERPDVDPPAAVLGPPVGPAWFAAMDRNRDGDLTRAEFLGTGRQFRTADRDGDGMIDVSEAESVSEGSRLGGGAAGREASVGGVRVGGAGPVSGETGYGGVGTGGAGPVSGETGYFNSSR